MKGPGSLQITYQAYPQDEDTHQPELYSLS